MPKEINPYWNIFQEEDEDESTVDMQYHRIYSNPPEIASALPTANQVGGDITLKSNLTEKFQLVGKSYIMARFRLVTAAAGAASATTVITTLANGGASLFSSVTFQIDGGSPIRVDHPGIAQRIYALLNYDRSKLESSCSGQWLYLDSCGEMSGTAAAPQTTPQLYARGVAGAVIQKYQDGGTNDFPAYNKGFAARFSRSQGGTECEIAIPLRELFGFAEVMKVMRGHQMTITVTPYAPASQNLILHGNGNAASVAAPQKVVMTKLEWWIPTVEPDGVTGAMIEKQLVSRKSTKYVWNERQVYISNQYDDAAQSTPTWVVTSNVARPVRAVLGFMHSRQYAFQNDAADPPTALQNANPGIFSRLAGINAVQLRINSKVMPNERYSDMNFQDERVTRPYADFLLSSGRFLDTDGVISKDEYLRMYPLFAWDLSAHSSIFEGVVTQDIQVEWDVNSTGTGGYKAVLYLEYERHIGMSALGDGRISITGAK